MHIKRVETGFWGGVFITSTLRVQLYEKQRSFIIGACTILFQKFMPPVASPFRGGPVNHHNLQRDPASRGDIRKRNTHLLDLFRTEHTCFINDWMRGIQP